MDHISKVACEQVDLYISGRLMLSERQVSLGSIRIVLEECFVHQVAKILHGVNQFFKSSGSNKVPGKMIPHVGFVVG